MDGAGKKIEKDLFQLSGLDRPSKGREAYVEADGDPFFRDLAGASGKDFLAAAADGKKAAFARAFGFEIAVGKAGRKPPGKMIFQGDTAVILFIILLWKACGFMGNLHVQGRGGCKRVSLYMVDGKNIIVKLICPCKGFVGRISLPVDRFQHNSQIL